MFLFSCKDEIKLSSEASLTSLTLTVGSTDYEVTFKDRQGTIKIPYSTKLPVKARVAAVTLSAKAKGVKVGDTLTILASEPLTLTVTAEDETTTQKYTVTVKKASANSEASITALTLTVGSEDYEVTFTGTQDTLRVVPYGTPIPATVGVKNIALSPGATTDAGTELGVTNNTVTLTVTAENGTTTQEYTVTLGFTTAGIISFTFEVPDNENMALDTADRKRIVGKIDHEVGTITFAQQSAYVYRDKLKATFEVSEEAAVQVGNEDQTSGTEQDFSAPVSYVVSAEGTETKTYTVTLLKSTRATIPDDRFRTILKASFPAAFTGDELDITHDDVINHNGSLSVIASDPKLTSLKGIEFFTALKTLYCDYNALTSLDVSKNTALTELSCSSNNLRSLNISENTALTYLVCGDNSLTSLDVSANTALTELYCSDNALTSLDVSANTALNNLNCESNSLTSLDMTGVRGIDSFLRTLSIGTGTGEDNPLLATLRVNIAIQDHAAIVTMKKNRGTALTITTVGNDGDVVCNDYDPANPGTCTQAP